MASKSVSETARGINVDEDSDAAYARLYASQIKPCDFRRWFSQVQQTGESLEMTEEMLGKLREYVEEGMTVDEAFKTHEPNFVGPGEFLSAYEKEVKSRAAEKLASADDAISPGAEQVQSADVVADTEIPADAILV